MKKVRVIVYGIGFMGSGMVRVLLDKEWIELVGGICRAYPDPKDIDKIKAGKDLGEVANVGRKLGIIVSDNPRAIFSEAKPDVILHATRFPAEDVESQIVEALNAGINVITITDSRLVYPWIHWPKLAQRVDDAAKKNGATILSTGLSPGFMNELVPIVFSGLNRKVNKFIIEAVGDLTPFGASALVKYGFGVTVDEFQKAMPDKIVTPARSEDDVPDSLFMFAGVDMVADALGWQLDETSLIMRPITSTTLKRSIEGMEIEPGRVCGVEEETCGLINGESVITTKRTMLLAPEEEGIEAGLSIFMDGDEEVTITVRGMRALDTPSYARAINNIHQVLEAKPGLVTIRDLPVAAALI